MQIDQTTLNDLYIFNTLENESVFAQFNNTQTNGGKYYLQKILLSPQKNIDQIIDVQNTIKFLMSIKQQIPNTINNGTIMVVEKFYETAISHYPTHPNFINSLSYSFFSKEDYTLTKYSLQYFIHFIKGLKEIENVLQKNVTQKIDIWLNKIEVLTSNTVLTQLYKEVGINNITTQNILKYANYLRHHFKQKCHQLIEVYCEIDAYISIVESTINKDLQFPNFIESNEPIIEVKDLYHLLLQKPISYHLTLKKENNFLFLTGANMAGKSTFIKAIGIAVYIAHLGLPVPAQNMQLSFFEGLLSNINVVDNIFKNESYFFNEVQRIKSTVEKIGDNKKWLVLIDELFKGTNIQDAMKCSTVVIEGLQRKQNTLFVLSTHLYEIGDNLTQHSNIQFKYFETSIINNELYFSYQLKNGISNDKLGYLILEKEGVVKLLQG